MILDSKKVDGYKTYIIGIAFICYALGGLVAGKLDINAAITAILTGLGIMGIRHGVEKVLNKPVV